MDLLGKPFIIVMIFKFPLKFNFVKNLERSGSNLLTAVYALGYIMVPSEKSSLAVDAPINMTRQVMHYK